MIFFWRGFGWIVPVLTLLLAVVFQQVIESMYWKGAYAQFGWPHTVAYLLSGVIIFFLGRHLNSKDHLKRKHDLFWIPMQYWGIIVALIGIFL